MVAQEVDFATWAAAMFLRMVILIGMFSFYSWYKSLMKPMRTRRRKMRKQKEKAKQKAKEMNANAQKEKNASNPNIDDEPHVSEKDCQSWFKSGKVPASLKLCVVSAGAESQGVLGKGVSVLSRAVRVTYSRPYLLVAKLLRARGFAKAVQQLVSKRVRPLALREECGPRCTRVSRLLAERASDQTIALVDMRAFWSATNCFSNGLARRVLSEGGFPDNVKSLLLDMYSEYQAVGAGQEEAREVMVGLKPQCPLAAELMALLYQRLLMEASRCLAEDVPGSDFEVFVFPNALVIAAAHNDVLGDFLDQVCALMSANSVAMAAGELATDNALTLFGASADVLLRSRATNSLLNSSKAANDMCAMQSAISKCCNSALPWWCD